MSAPPVAPAAAHVPAPAAEPEGAPPSARARSAGKAAAAGGAAGARGTAPASARTSARARALQRAPAAPTPSIWAAAAPAGSAAPQGYAAPRAAAGGEWAFLDAKGTSIEDKLFLFMKKVLEKTDQELVDKMKEYKARFTQAAPAPAKKGMSLFDVAKAVVPGLDAATKLVGEAAIKKLASQVGGPVLAAAATAAGLPQLAPLALKYGGDLAQLAFKDVGGSSAAPASSAGAGSPDEKLAMLEIQVLVEKQQRMFEAVSGTLKAMHDAQMAAVRNLT